MVEIILIFMIILLIFGAWISLLIILMDIFEDIKIRKKK